VTPITGEISPQGASGIGGTQPVERNRLKPRRGEENQETSRVAASYWRCSVAAARGKLVPAAGKLERLNVSSVRVN